MNVLVVSTAVHAEAAHQSISSNHGVVHAIAEHLAVSHSVSHSISHSVSKTVSHVQAAVAQPHHAVASVQRLGSSNQAGKDQHKLHGGGHFEFLGFRLVAGRWAV